MSPEEIEKKKRLVAIAYVSLFVTLFVTATIVSWRRRVEDARNAKDAAPVSTASQTAPVPSAR